MLLETILVGVLQDKNLAFCSYQISKVNMRFDAIMMKI